MSLAILIPVWNDWPSAEKLLGEIDGALRQAEQPADVWLVDDGSSIPAPAALSGYSILQRVRVLELFGNVGHQRALATGLGYLQTSQKYDQVLLMDSDGEDKPSDIPALLAAAKQRPGAVAVAQRAKRSESAGFRLGYLIYKFVFYLCTGKQIAFGNFLLLPARPAEILAYSAYAGSHLAASVVRLNFPLAPVPVHRGRRYFGRSSMNYVSLVLHGLSAIAVFSDLVITRVILLTGFFALLSSLGIAAVWAVRIFTELAVPGWATYVSLFLFLILVQSVFAGLFLSFLTLSLKQSLAWIPAAAAKINVKGVKDLYAKH